MHLCIADVSQLEVQATSMWKTINAIRVWQIIYEAPASRRQVVKFVVSNKGNRGHELHTQKKKRKQLYLVLNYLASFIPSVSSTLPSYPSEGTWLFILADSFKADAYSWRWICVPWKFANYISDTFTEYRQGTICSIYSDSESHVSWFDRSLNCVCVCMVWKYCGGAAQHAFSKWDLVLATSTTTCRNNGFLTIYVLYRVFDEKWTILRIWM